MVNKSETSMKMYVGLSVWLFVYLSYVVVERNLVFFCFLASSSEENTLSNEIVRLTNQRADCLCKSKGQKTYDRQADENFMGVIPYFFH